LGASGDTLAPNWQHQSEVFMLSRVLEGLQYKRMALTNWSKSSRGLPG